MKIFFLFLLFCFSSLALAGERPISKVPDSVDLPRDQVQEYRALEAEARALRAEAALSIQSMIQRQREIMISWQKLIGEEDLAGWELDQSQAKLKRRAKGQ